MGYQVYTQTKLSMEHNRKPKAEGCASLGVHPAMTLLLSTFLSKLPSCHIPRTFGYLIIFMACIKEEFWNRES